MIKSKIVFFAFTIIFLIISLSAIQSSSGIAGRTGSPGESTCSSCHSGGTGNTVISITANPEFINNQFIPGQTYTVNLNVSNNSYSYFGVGCEVLNASNNTNAGIFKTPLNGVKFVNAPNGRTNVVHTIPKNGVGSASFSFEWVAPNSSENIVFYIAAVAANNNSNINGDAVGTTTLTLTPSVNYLVGFKEVSFFTYPNPVLDKIYIQAQSILYPLSIEIWDMHGTRLLTEDLNSKNSNPICLDLPQSLANGIYILKLISENKLLGSKFILIRR